MATREKVAVVVGMLAEGFDRTLSDAMLEAYWIGVGDLSDELLDIAATKVLRGNYKFMPKPGELRVLAVTRGRGAELFAADAWVTLCKAIKRVGSGRSVNFRDALINATVAYLGGWERCCSQPLEEFEKWYKREFINTYVAFAQDGPPEDSSGYLIGEQERENAKWVGHRCVYETNPDTGLRERTGIYHHPPALDVECGYTPIALAPPAVEQMKQLTQRPKEMPRIELKRV